MVHIVCVHILCNLPMPIQLIVALNLEAPEPIPEQEHEYGYRQDRYDGWDIGAPEQPHPETPKSDDDALEGFIILLKVT